ncbi:MAG: proliferating cell nuclear antigen (pcna) [Euryarchaeota archaeon]|nr:proliferating cell nuclear antigen (pcna) [Euryarchaeota archaeon]
MFRATVKADVLKHIVEATSTLVDEAKIHITTDGVSLKAVDPAHVAMVDLSLGAKAFESYEAGDLELGLDLEKFKDVLKLAGSADTVKMEYHKDSHRLVMRMGNLVRRVGLVDTAGMPDPKVPNLNLPNKVVVSAEELHRAIKGSESLSDHVTVIADPEFFEISAESDLDALNLRLPKEELIELEAAERTKSMFSLDYLSNMIKAVRSGGALTMHLGSDYPVKMEFDLADGNGHCVYLLAPRIETD